MMSIQRASVALGLVLGAAAALVACSGLRTERVAGPAQPEVEVQLCDGETTVHARPGQTREEGQAIADSLMAQWREKHPDEDWEATVRSQHMIRPPYDNSGLLEGQQAGTWQHYTDRDLLLWRREVESFVAEGARIFHSGDELGSTISVSCDMCHPDAANTHPETYPKFQTQLGRVVLLRDMINWCIGHPVRAEQPLAPDSRQMRALEAYILAQRSGTPLSYGKH